jgi:hypothetical protein
MKIAICISGQTRDWHDYPSKNLAYFISTLEAAGHEVDVFGHTWSHCIPPSEEHVKFKKLIIDDQVIIDDWVKQDWANRLTLNDTLCDLFNYDTYDQGAFDMTTLEYDNLSDDHINKILQYCRAGYGQHVSGWKSFQLADDGYDMYLRWRWDLVFTKDNSIASSDQYRYLIDYWAPYLQDIITSFHSVSYSSTDNINILFGGNTIIHNAYSACVDDIFFGFSLLAKQKINAIDIFDAIDTCFDPIHNDGFPYINKALYHTFWTWCMTDLIEMEGVCKLPGCVSMTHQDTRFL